MDPKALIEQALEATVGGAGQGICPPGLAEAVKYSVFPGGARVRPLLCLGVAAAAGTPNAASVAAAASIELLHCASLVHDDLPCFDDADERRGKPSVHRAYGQPLAVLAGDALIILAFDSIVTGCRANIETLPQLVSILAKSVSMTNGIVGGQAWECEKTVALPMYHAAKTGALFVASAKAGAASVGGCAEDWESFGGLLGEAYQVADDIRDAFSTASEIGKPVGRDAALDRPNVIAHLGAKGAMEHLDRLVERALAAVPECPGAVALRAQVRSQVRWLIPKDQAQFAA